MRERQKKQTLTGAITVAGYDAILADVAGLLESARRTSARAVNAVMTATYWQIGRRIVEFEQGGVERAGYGRKLIQRLSSDLSKRFGRGFGVVNLTQMRRFYMLWPSSQILQTLSEEFPRLQAPRRVPHNSGKPKPAAILQTASEEFADETTRRSTHD